MHRIHQSCMPNCLPDHVTIPVTSNADKITNFALDKIQHLIDGAAVVLPKATHYALEVVSIQCLIDAIGWALLLLPLVLCAILARYMILKGLDGLKGRRDKYDDGYCAWMIPGWILAGLNLILLIVFICNVPYWSFIGINHPDLYLVHLAVNKFLN